MKFLILTCVSMLFFLAACDSGGNRVRGRHCKDKNNLALDLKDHNDKPSKVLSLEESEVVNEESGIPLGRYVYESIQVRYEMERENPEDERDRLIVGLQHAQNNKNQWKTSSFCFRGKPADFDQETPVSDGDFIALSELDVLQDGRLTIRGLASFSFTLDPKEGFVGEVEGFEDPDLDTFKKVYELEGGETRFYKQRARNKKGDKEDKYILRRHFQRGDDVNIFVSINYRRYPLEEPVPKDKVYKPVIPTP